MSHEVCFVCALIYNFSSKLNLYLTSCFHLCSWNKTYLYIFLFGLAFFQMGYHSANTLPLEDARKGNIKVWTYKNENAPSMCWIWFGMSLPCVWLFPGMVNHVCIGVDLACHYFVFDCFLAWSILSVLYLFQLSNISHASSSCAMGCHDSPSHTITSLLSGLWFSSWIRNGAYLSVSSSYSFLIKLASS